MTPDFGDDEQSLQMLIEQFWEENRFQIANLTRQKKASLNGCVIWLNQEGIMELERLPEKIDLEHLKATTEEIFSKLR